MKTAYDLEFGNLKPGLHDFEYVLDKNFFSLSEESLIKNGKVDVHLQVERGNNHLTLTTRLKGYVECECDICLSDLDYPVASEEVLQVKLTDSPGEEEPDLIYVGRNEHKLSMYRHFYDYVHLALPMKKVCEDSLNRDACDEHVIERLNKVGKTESRPNPEWDKLKDLFK